MEGQYTPGGAMMAIGPTATGELAAPASKRKRQPRNSACAPCVKTKMKCTPGPEGGRCERCDKMGRECFPAPPKPPRQRTERVSLASNGFEDPGPSYATATSSTFASYPLQDTNAMPIPKRKLEVIQPAEPASKLLAKHDLHHKNSSSFTALLVQSLRIDPAQENMLRGIDSHSVKRSFVVFRQYARYFPFINPNQSDDAAECVTHRPLLTVAVCAVSAASDPDLQLRLSNAIRLSISERSILSNEQSIDLLLGLMVNLAWNHHYLDKPQLSQNLYLLAGMAADNGIHRMIPEDVIPANQASDIERQRALVGCYYLCSMLSRSALNSPSPLRWSEGIRRCAINVGRVCPLPTDKDLYSLVELSLAMEEFQDVCQRCRATGNTQPQLIELQARATQNRLKSLRRAIPSLTIEPACTAALIETYEKTMLGSEMGGAPSQIQCAFTVKEYLDDLLSQPSNTFHRMSIVDWTSLLNIVLLTANISKPLPNTNSWEAGALTTMLPPEEYMNTLIARMEVVIGDDPLAPRHDGLVQFFRAFCDVVKQHIVRDTSAGLSRTLGNSASAMPPMPYPPSGSTRFTEALRDGVLDTTFLRKYALAA